MGMKLKYYDEESQQYRELKVGIKAPSEIRNSLQAATDEEIEEMLGGYEEVSGDALVRGNMIIEGNSIILGNTSITEAQLKALLTLLS